MSSFAKRFGNLTVQQAKELNEKAKYKHEIITKLYTIWKNPDTPVVYKKWVQQAAQYINSMEGNNEYKR